MLLADKDDTSRLCLALLLAGYDKARALSFLSSSFIFSSTLFSLIDFRAINEIRFGDSWIESDTFLGFLFVFFDDNDEDDDDAAAVSDSSLSNPVEDDNGRRFCFFSRFSLSSGDIFCREPSKVASIKYEDSDSSSDDFFFNIDLILVFVFCLFIVQDWGGVVAEVVMPFELSKLLVKLQLSKFSLESVNLHC